MKRETILKTIFILIVGTILFAMPVNVFAEATDLDEFWEDQGELEDIEGETPEETPTIQEQEETPAPSTETTTEQEETLPEAGLVEDTMMVVTILGLGVLATVAYKKINEYKNI